MNTRLRISGTALATLAIAGCLALVPTTAASAYSPAVDDACDTLSVTLDGYAASEELPTPNEVMVRIDGVDVASDYFGASYRSDFAIADPTVAYEWEVIVDALEEGYESNDVTLSGTSTPCAPEPTPVVENASAVASVSAASCSSPAVLVLHTPAFATWGTPSATTGPAEYTVTATALEGHAFDDGAATRVFTGSLAAAMSSDDPACAAALPPRPPAQSSATLVDFVNCATGTVTTTTTTITIDWVLDYAGTSWVAATPASAVTEVVRVATDTECVPAVIPEVSSTTIVPTVAGLTIVADTELAETGDAATPPIAALGLLLLAAGAGLLLPRARRS